MFGSGWTSGTSQTQLSKIAAPPTKKSYRNALFLLFLAPFIGPAPFAILERIYGVTPLQKLPFRRLRFQRLGSLGLQLSS